MIVSLLTLNHHTLDRELRSAPSDDPVGPAPRRAQTHMILQMSEAVKGIFSLLGEGGRGLVGWTLWLSVFGTGGEREERAIRPVL